MNDRIEAQNLSPDVPNARIGFEPEENPRSGGEVPSDKLSLALATIKAQAELAAQQRVYPETATARVDAGAVVVGTSFVLLAKLFNVAIKSGYIENNSGAAVSVYRGSTASGVPVITINAGRAATFCVGQDIFELSVGVAGQVGTGAVILNASSEVWPPARYTI